jgi:hypothetical protein
MRGVPQGADPREQEPAHDVLAAEAFAVPAADPVLSHKQPVRIPADPSGIPEAHDVLAAEEFAMPAPAGRSHDTEARGALAKGAKASRRGGIIAAVALVGGVVLRRRRGK